MTGPADVHAFAGSDSETISGTPTIWRRSSIEHEVGETSTLVTLVAGGLGAAIVPEAVTALTLEGVTYRPLAGPPTTMELEVAHRPDRTEPHLVRAVEGDSATRYRVWLRRPSRRSGFSLNTNGDFPRAERRQTETLRASFNPAWSALRD
ncbi:LysR substrate-binding domain-containing protein [Nocardia sp. NPDC050630]|uniref:LysR substrate-binding domain-containing protein n=1 Tax=Nocardia sp. NPDC050630 TaxID=3364321 RepID=UPI0037AAA32C